MSAILLKWSQKMLGSCLRCWSKAFELHIMLTHDIILEEDHVDGVVIQWSRQSKCLLSDLHGSIAIRSKVVIDATGTISFLVKRLSEQSIRHSYPKGCGSLWVDEAETNSSNSLMRSICLIVAGMSATSTYGAPRMGPIFGGYAACRKESAELAYDKIMGVKS